MVETNNTFDQINHLDTFMTSLLENFFEGTGTEPSASKIREQIEDFRKMALFNSIDDEASEEFAKMFEERHTTMQDFGFLLKNTTYHPWLDANKSRIDFYLWNRYKKFMTHDEKKPKNVVTALDLDTDEIVDHLQNPEAEGPWDRRGLVLGHVQSGKTANYTGVVCKASDAGYKLIIIIAGVNNNLRNQTQIRIDSGFTGIDSSNLLSTGFKQTVGVGLIEDRIGGRPNTFTSRASDFKKTTADSINIPLQNMNTPAVFVIKKNSGILKNLIQWLKDTNAKHGVDKVNEPMLIIDDEADNASINAKYGQGEVAKINGQIRALLDLFNRSCYVGYTATPFANIFIDPDDSDKMLGDDLFPRDFIISLDPPTNYMGPAKWFLNTQNKSILEINDNQTTIPIGHKKEHKIPYLPASLKKAIRQFVITEAIRKDRNISQKHSSMLINASIYNNVQGNIKSLVHEELDKIKSAVSVHAGKSTLSALADLEMQALHTIWKDYFEQSQPLWSKVQENLHNAASPIKVVEINSKSSDALDYGSYTKDGLHVIAIGGYALSRGLTLEGLNISYYLRRSMTSDTLMQMCRWFGYRNGYEDLCKVWMPDEAREWYEYISESMEMLREDLRQMSALNKTPQDFGLKIRSHPDNLMITARNKMGSANQFTLEVDLSEKMIETWALKNDHSIFAKHRLNVKTLVKELEQNKTPVPGSSNNEFGYLVKNVPVSIIRKFIARFKNDDEICVAMKSESILDYIDQRVDRELSEWDILIQSNKTATEGGGYNEFGFPINYPFRTSTSKSTGDHLILSTRSRVTGAGIAKAGLSESTIASIEKRVKRERPEINTTPDHYFFRGVDRNPLLILQATMPINPPIPISEPVVTYGLVFPETALKKFTNYVVTTTWFRQQYEIDSEEEDIYAEE